MTRTQLSGQINFKSAIGHPIDKILKRELRPKGQIERGVDPRGGFLEKKRRERQLNWITEESKLVVGHADKPIRTAIEYAAGHGWTVRKAGPRAPVWGRLYGPHGDRTGCALAVYSTPRRAEDHAKDIRWAVDSCPHA